MVRYAQLFAIVASAAWSVAVAAAAVAMRAGAAEPLRGWPFTQEGLGMPRSQMGLALFDEAVRIWGPGLGSVAIRYIHGAFASSGSTVLLCVAGDPATTSS